MSDSTRKFSRGQRIIKWVAVIAVLWICGCEEFFAQKSTGAQAESIINDLRGIETAPEPNIPIPEVYKQPPKIIRQVVGGKPEFKLFYFCRHHTSDELRQIVHAQFATKLFDKKGKETKLVDYTVSSNPATNQLIVRCPTREDANAVLELLEMVDVQPIQVKIDCIISEVYADKTLDWQTTILIQELLGEDIWLGPAGQRFGATVMDLLTEGEPLPAFPGASLRELARAKMGLKMGYWSTKHNFLAVVDLLESQGYLKILMNPTLEVVNGKTAKVSSLQKVPLQQTYLKDPQAQWYETKIEYEDVIDSLQITPHVFADSYIGLETTIVLGSKLTPEGVKQLPIITKKEIENKENRIRQGESLVIGGIRKTERRDVVRGVPFLKDIPVLGILFSGRDFEERVVETIFILTPTISTGGIPREEMIEEVKRKQELPSSGALHKAITDPLGLEAQKQEYELKLEQAEKERLKAVEEKTKAQLAADQAKTEAEKLKTEAEKIATEVTEAKVQVQKANAEAEKARAQADKLKVELEKSKAEAHRARVEAERAKAEAEARANAETEKAEAEKGKTDAQKAKAEPDKAEAEGDKAKDNT